MKTNKFQTGGGLIAAVTIFLCATPAHGGIMDILRGEKAETGKVCECEDFQRVAFIGPAEVKEVQGNVELLTGINKWSRLKEGKTLSPGDMLRTQPGAKAILKMKESGSLVRVTPRTVLRLVPLERDWDKSALTGKSEADGFVVRALRGEAQYRAQKGWKKLTMDSEVQPGTKIRLVSGQQIDLFSRDHGIVRLSERGETILPGARQTASRQLRTIPPVVAASVGY